MLIDKALTICIIAGTLAACEPSTDKDTADRPGESPGELDPGPPRLPSFETDDGSGVEIPDLSGIAPTPASAEACYLGPARDHAACLGTVEWDESWGSSYDYPPPYGGDDQYAAPVRYLDLDALDPSTSLAPNFVLSEFASAAKGRFGLFQAHVVEYMQIIRDDIGGPLRINSGYRNVDYNAGIGGATYSRHMYGDAVDIASDAASLSELASLCASLGAGYVDTYATHVHCDWRDDPLDPAFYPVAAAALSINETSVVIGLPENAEGSPLPSWTLEDAAGRALLAGTGREAPRLPGAARISLRTSPLGPVQTLALSRR